jgi:hypothetical protein
MANPWDEAYSQYANQARSGDITADFIRKTYGGLEGMKSEKGNSFADRVIAIHQELEDQKKKYKVPTSAGKIGEADTVWDTAFRLAETGTDSLYDLGQRQKEVVGHEGEGGGTYTSLENELYHKPTGATVTMPHHGFKNEYRLQFTPDGTPIPYSTNQRSDWVEFRDDFARPAASFIGSFIPGVGPYIAAANAAYAASKGDWEKALMSGLAAAVPMAGQFGASASTAATLQTVQKAASVLKALESKDLLGAVLGGANLAGVSEISGFDMKDINKAVGMVKALQSEDPMAIVKAGAGYLPTEVGQGVGAVTALQSGDPMAILRAGLGYLPKGGGGGGGGDDDEIFGGGGSDSDTRGYFDEITGKFILDDNGALNSGDLTNETSGTNLDSMKDYKYNPDTGNWTMPDGTEIDTSYMQNSKTPLTGQQVMNNAGAGGPKTPGTQPKPGAPGTPPKQQTPGSGMDVNALMSLLGGGQQQAPTVVSSGQDNSADVQLMENIFGTTLSAPPAGDTATQARELARLLRS